MSADYANWLLTGGAENVSGNLYATFDFSSDLQAWTNLAVYRPKRSGHQSTQRLADRRCQRLCTGRQP